MSVSFLRVLRIIRVVLPEHPSDTKVLTMKMENPSIEPIFFNQSLGIVGFNSLVHSLRALSTLRRSDLRTPSAAAKPCQGDFSEFYLITSSLRKKSRLSLKNDMSPQDRMTKVIKGEFEKLEDLMVKDVLLTCDTSLEVFNIEFNRMSRMDDDLFTYEVEVANILCDSNKDDDSEQRVSHEGDDDMGYDPSDVAFTKWLGLKFFNYKTMDHYTKKALWI
ncbi:hypothetical protein Tco_1038247 [Tanacetum coccineum]